MTTAAEIYENFAQFTMNWTEAETYAARALGSREPKSDAVIAQTYRVAREIFKRLERIAPYVVPFGQRPIISRMLPQVQLSNGNLVRFVSFENVGELRYYNLDGVVVLDPLSAPDTVRQVVKDQARFALLRFDEAQRQQQMVVAA